MSQLTSIKNSTLRDLIKKSPRFNKFTSEKQEEYLQKIAKLSEEKQQQLCGLFVEEQSMPTPEEQQSKILDDYIAKIHALSAELKRKVRQKDESHSKESEAAELDTLLNHLNQTN